MKIRFFCTLRREKVEFSPIELRTVKMYTCGPTVYNFPHIGNLRTYIAEDLLRRSLEYFGFKVIHVMNITDVDDKTIKGSISKNISLKEYTEIYKEAFIKDIENLKILKAHHFPEASAHIEDMIEMIKKLVEKGHAYTGDDGSIYYRIKSFKDYGKLSHLNLEDLKPGASNRIATDEYSKQDVCDFVLWKSYDSQRDGEIYWKSPFGNGRPGWHLECSAMATKLLGESIDIHMGGVDNIFPHHENEIAQSEAISGKNFANFWIHVAHLVVNGKKMAKSEGNFFTVQDIVDKGYSYADIRLFLLQTHFSMRLNFTFEGLQSAKNSLKRINDFIKTLRNIDNNDENFNADDVINDCKRNFDDAIADNVNISVALSAVFALMNESNKIIDNGAMNKKSALKILSTMENMNAILAVMDFDNDKKIPDAVLKLAKDRDCARTSQNWELSDKIRLEIQSMGYQIIDTPQGTRIRLS